MVAGVDGGAFRIVEVDCWPDLAGLRSQRAWATNTRANGAVHGQSDKPPAEHPIIGMSYAAARDLVAVGGPRLAVDPD
jgi:hypothetical protein